MTIKQESAPLSKEDSIIEDSSKAIIKKKPLSKRKIPLSEHYQKTTIKSSIIEASSLPLSKRRQ
nr:hypothetical protein [Tanacetum cinerariifolium]